MIREVFPIVKYLSISISTYNSPTDLRLNHLFILRELENNYVNEEIYLIEYYEIYTIMKIYNTNILSVYSCTSSVFN